MGMEIDLSFLGMHSCMCVHASFVLTHVHFLWVLSASKLEYISYLYINAVLPFAISCFDCSIENRCQAFLPADFLIILFTYYSVFILIVLAFPFLFHNFMILFIYFLPSMKTIAQLMLGFCWKYLLACFGIYLFKTLYNLMQFYITLLSSIDQHPHILRLPAWNYLICGLNMNILEQDSFLSWRSDQAKRLLFALNLCDRP